MHAGHVRSPLAVHHGQPDDFRVLIALLRGARRRLKPGGVLWLVAQEQVPVGRLLALHGRFAWVRATEADGGRFVVWSAGGKRRVFGHVAALLNETEPGHAGGDGGDDDAEQRAPPPRRAVPQAQTQAQAPSPSAGGSGAVAVHGSAPDAALSRTARRREGRKRKRDATRAREEDG